MRQSLFLHIMNDLVVKKPTEFSQRFDALGIPGLSPQQKMMVALRMLAYGASADQLDEYIHMSESSILKFLKLFCQATIEIYGNQYLRKPTAKDLGQVLKLHESKGWPGMLGCLDVMHWEWKNCPVAWRGAFQGKEGVPTVALEAVVDHRLWFWHAWFGMPGSNNDLNILDRSPLFEDLSHGRAPQVTFTANGKEYTQGYYLADGIYPSWKIFVKTISEPQNPKRQLFSQCQEGQRKDVEHAFGVLQVSYLFDESYKF